MSKDDTVNVLACATVLLVTLGLLLYAVYDGVPLDTSVRCDGTHGACKGSIVGKTRELLGVQ